MKTFLRSVPVLAFALLAARAPAANPPAPMPAALQEMAAVERFLSLSDAELDLMLQVIARIRAMKPAERTALQAEIARFRQLPEAERQQMRQGWGGMPAEIQEGWREMMQQATNERRSEIQAKLQALSPEEKMVYRRALVEEYLQGKAKRR